MPRYYFHVIDGQDILDETGSVLPNDAAAIAVARRAAGELIHEWGPSFWDNSSWHMEVTSDLGQVVLKLDLAISSSEAKIH